MKITKEQLNKDYFQLDENYSGKLILPGDGYLEKDNFEEFFLSIGKNFRRGDDARLNGEHHVSYHRPRSYVNSYNRFNIPLTYEEVLKMKPEFDGNGKLIPPCGWRVMESDEIFTEEDVFVYCMNSRAYPNGKFENVYTDFIVGCSVKNYKSDPGFIWLGLHQIKPTITVKVDGIDVPLTDEQIKFVKDSKKKLKEEEEKNIVKVGDMITRFYPNGDVKIFKSTTKFNLKQSDQYFRSSPNEIKVWENWIRKQ